MFNQNSINSSVLNQSFLALVTAEDSIGFNGFNLQDGDLCIETIDYDDLKEIDINSFQFPRQNGGALLSKYYRGRTVRMKWALKKGTGAELNDAIDHLKRDLALTEWFLNVKVNGITRRIRATCIDITFNRQHYNISFCPVQIVFKTQEPFWYATSEEVLSTLGFSSNFGEEFVSTGTAQTEPRMVFTFGVGTNVSKVEIIMWSKISVTNTFIANDILEVNSEAKTVKKNGAEIDYTWVFPVFSPWSNNFLVDFTGSVLVDFNCFSKKNFL